MSTPRAGDDRGIAMVIVALCLLVLMVMAAFAVDLGLAYNERRQDQSAADAGALAGAVEISFLSPTAQAITDQVIDHVNATLDTPIPDAAWLTDCPVSEPPATFVAIGAAGLGSATPATRCISISGEELRVRVPDQAVETTFARVIGVNSLTVNAFAHARIELPLAAQTPPFVVPPSGANSGQEICLRSTAGGLPEPAQLPYDANRNGTDNEATDLDPCHTTLITSGAGSFGTVDPRSYRANPCDNGTDVLAYSLAAGIDHTLSRFPSHYTIGTTGVRQDGALCNAAARPAFPNSMSVTSGISTPTMTCGLTGRSGGGCDPTGPPYGTPSPALARFRRGSFVTGDTWGGRPIDSKPLWSLLIDNPSAPSECRPVVFGTGPASYVGNMNSLLTCLEDWKPSDGPIFDDQILESARFTFLPVIAEAGVLTAPLCALDVGIGNSAAAGGQCVHFDDFVPAFFHRLYGVVSGSSEGACDPGPPGARLARMTVGDGYPDCDAEDIDMVSGIVFSCGMLPEEICKQRPPVTPDDPTGDPVYAIRLVR